MGMEMVRMDRIVKMAMVKMVSRSVQIVKAMLIFM
jgi:hypothetical protein